MSTPARIGYEDPTNNRIYSVYLHCDGDTRWAGKTLLDHYNTLERIKILVALGSLSVLEMYASQEEAPGLLPRLEKSRPYPVNWRKHTFDYPACNVTIAYKRDRGDSGKVDILISSVFEDYLDHNYLFIHGAWMHKPEIGVWKPLVVGRQVGKK